MDFKAGDKVRIRSWDDMEKEFGLDSDGDIKCDGFFTTCMRDLCGKEFTITEIDSENSVYGHDFGSTITTDMITLVGDRKSNVEKEEKQKYQELIRFYSSQLQEDKKEDIESYIARLRPDLYKLIKGAEESV